MCIRDSNECEDDDEYGEDDAVNGDDNEDGDGMMIMKYAMTKII